MKMRILTAAAGLLGIVALPALRPGAGIAGEEKEAPKAAAKPHSTEYVGPVVCKGCHPEEYKVWAGSKHGRSFVALGTAMARKISGEPNAYAGMPTKKMMAECSPCHARGMEVPRQERAEMHPEDGVQCEICHGPGGHYAAEEIMKDPKRRVEAGLGKLNADGCLQCHKPKESHGVLGRAPFDFAKYWERIRHGKGTMKQF